jgi:two-component system alkaline phosphatase synthesis response regulator PhoP
MRNSSSSGPGKCGKILLVDDHKLGLAARRSVLEELGHTVVTAANGQAAYELAKAEFFDLVITDWKMPKMDGLELIRQLRDEEYVTPIILISGFAEGVGLTEAKTGADVILQKSSNEVVQMVSAVKRLLNRKAPRKPAGRQEDPPANAKPARGKSKLS